MAETEARPLSMLESFKLYVWCMWRAGWQSEESTAKMLGFLDRLTEKETINFCFAELKDLVERHPEIYSGSFNGSIVNGKNVQAEAEVVSDVQAAQNGTLVPLDSEGKTATSTAKP